MCDCLLVFVSHFQLEFAAEGSWIKGGGRIVSQLPQDERLPSPQATNTFNGEIHHPNRSGGLGPRGTPPGGPPLVPGGPIVPMGPTQALGPQLHQFRGITPYVSVNVLVSCIEKDIILEVYVSVFSLCNTTTGNKLFAFPSVV